MKLWLALASLGLLVGSVCPHGDGASPLAPEPSPTSEDLQWRMTEHFDQVAAIRSGVVVGDLATVAENAEVLASRTQPEDYPPAWRPAVVDLLAQTDALRTVTSVADAAAGTARLAGSCGACHEATEAKPVFGDAMEPSEDDTLGARMERHEWAVDRMWEGIVGPSDEWWERGAAVFVGASGCHEDFSDSPEGERMRVLCRTVHTLGKRAGSATRHEDRVQLYGDFLATCSACHAGPK